MNTFFRILLGFAAGVVVAAMLTMLVAMFDSATQSPACEPQPVEQTPLRKLT